MMEHMEESQDSSASVQSKDGPSDEVVDLSGDQVLMIDISDALSERDKVKFTVHTRTSMSEFRQPEFSVVRQHEEFMWLHDRFEENEANFGIIIPPAPPRPDFDASREKLQRLGEGENTMTKDEFQKMKQELESIIVQCCSAPDPDGREQFPNIEEKEYLASFKKTVAMHEVFLQRLAAHPVLRNDLNFKVFLEYEQELSIRGKNSKEKLTGFFKTMTQSLDEVLLANLKDKDDFFEGQRTFLAEYLVRVKEATAKADAMTASHKNVSDSYIKISTTLGQAALADGTKLATVLNKASETMDKARKLEGRVASDEDLKLSDTLKYYVRDTTAAQNLVYQRLRLLANFENATKAVDKARAKNKDVQQAEDFHHELAEKFSRMSEVSMQELTDFRVRRIAHFKKNLVDLAELELKHARAQVQLLRSSIAAIKEME